MKEDFGSGMGTAIKYIVAAGLIGFLLNQALFADEMVHKFKSPSFNGQGTSAHYLTIENQETSRKDYKGTNREYSDYDVDKRKTPPPKSFTATKKEFNRFMKIEEFFNGVRLHFPDCEEIIYEDFIKDKDIIPNPDYTKIMTNYDEICEWFTTYSI